MRRTADTAGFSLIELLIAVAVLGVITSQMFLVLSTQRRTYVGSTRTMDVQESARLVTDLMAFDTRMAGLMVPRFAGVSSVDGGNNAADRLCVSDPDIFTIPESVDNDPLWDSRDARFTGPRLSGAGISGSTITLDTLDVDDAGAANDFQVDRGLILSDGARTFCSRIIAFPGPSQIRLADSPQAGFSTAATAVPAIIYEVDGALNLRRNNVVLSSVIEDLQVEYWVDEGPPNCDGIIDADEFPVHDLNAAKVPVTDLERVRLVRLSVVARAQLADEASGAVMSRHRRPAVANRTVGSDVADAFRRRRFSTSVLPRNLLARPTTDPSNCAFIP